jgi:hypothetical protein
MGSVIVQNMSAAVRFNLPTSVTLALFALQLQWHKLLQLEVNFRQGFHIKPKLLAPKLRKACRFCISSFFYVSSKEPRNYNGVRCCGIHYTKIKGIANVNIDAT